MEEYSKAFRQPTFNSTIRIDYFWSLAFYVLIFVGISPFSSNNGVVLDTEGSGSFLRQILFLLVSTGIAYTYFRKYRRKIFSSLPWSTALVLAWVLTSVLWSVSPDLSLRRGVLVILITTSSFAIVEILGVDGALRLLKHVLAWVIMLDLLSIPIVPGATHYYEGQQVWAGMHGHKNNAGTIATFAAMLFFHFAWHDRRWQDAALFFLALFFLVGTISKTSIALLAILILGAVSYRIAERNVYRRMVFKIVFIVFSCVLLFGYFSYEKEIFEYIDDPSQLTGRGYLWKAVFSYAQEQPWLGAGYGAFWQGVNAPALMYLNAFWAQGINHAHNSYFDLLANIGLIGLTFSIFAFVIAPFHWVLSFGVDSKAGALVFAWLIFGAVGSVTKTLFLYGASPEWVTVALMIAVAHHSARVPRQSLNLYDLSRSKRSRTPLHGFGQQPDPVGKIIE